MLDEGCIDVQRRSQLEDGGMDPNKNREDKHDVISKIALSNAQTFLQRLLRIRPTF